MESCGECHPFLVATNGRHPSDRSRYRTDELAAVSAWETGSRQPLDGWWDISVADNAAPLGGAVVAQHNVEWSFRDREPILDGYAGWGLGSHVNGQRTVRVEVCS